jgi:hypothetical protein
MNDRRKIDLDRYLRTKVKILNDTGGRGFDRGVRTFNCPLCRDTKGRGFVNVSYWSAGCFNIGCVACERLDGGALEWARRIEGVKTRADMFIALRDAYGTEQVVQFRPAPREGEDFVRFPREMRPLARQGSDRGDPVAARTYLKFIERQWGITEADAALWSLGYCTAGYYAQRVIVPIIMNGIPVAFQARTIADGEPKYLTSRHGPKDDPKSECARSAAEILYNYDRISEGGSVVLVEGVGDVMGWHRGGNLGRIPTASAMLGISLTPEKLALLAAKSLDRVILAPDDEVPAQRQAAGLLGDLRAWDVPAFLGSWVGGKDAGSGAALVEQPPLSLADQVRARLG